MPEDLLTQLEKRPGVQGICVELNEFGAYEVTFRTPFADPGRDGWACGVTKSEALQEALFAEEFLRTGE
jgi:hypothetical protein